MRKILIALAATAGIGLIYTSNSMAAPLSGAAVLGSVDAAALPVQDARVFCYNRSTGRFLHWGSCGRPTRIARPRVYCKNRYTGRFIHWGAC